MVPAIVRALRARRTAEAPPIPATSNADTTSLRLANATFR